ncbi:hypothetical protein [Roseovarius indicus]|uniref:Uncharacterized protein n=1 Tax=Roseovarius indicus TaxID=540747 RepID=A0A0T5PAR6_9RHOB|nr:hypothetical protein [Roseovarius indicus]KRS18243.1 hypothetical protein XM52_08840 [Roseovarius indicus]QEW26924.1 hypothetical protein RIdsm_02731 [Roseovarius indicus]SFD57737.1 hypothetical protein SAMN04488031_101613 [Roseovarius indicus]
MGAAVIRAALYALMVLVTGPAPAETYKIENIGSGDPRGATDGLSFTYDVHLRLELLLGEPVVGTRFRWQLNPNFSEVEVSELVTDKRRRVKLLNLPRESQLKARIYDVDIEFEMSGATGVYYLLADGGDPGPGDGKTWSFNVPGSPDWSEMFYRTPLDGPDDRADYVSEKEAKRIWKEGLRLHTARLVDVKVSTHDLVRWYVQQSKAPEVAVTQKAIRNLAEGIREGFGYDLDAEEFAEVTPEDRWDTEGMSGLPEEEGLRAAEIDYQILSERLGKLLAMPKKFEPTGELILFDAAVAELRSDIAALADKRTERGLRDYPLKLGLSPREFEEGHDIEVQPQYRMINTEGEIRQQIVWDSDLGIEYDTSYDQAVFDAEGNQVTPFATGYRSQLIFNRYVAFGGCLFELPSGDMVTEEHTYEGRRYTGGFGWHCGGKELKEYPNILLSELGPDTPEYVFDERRFRYTSDLDEDVKWAGFDGPDGPVIYMLKCNGWWFEGAVVFDTDLQEIGKIGEFEFGSHDDTEGYFSRLGASCG